MIFTFVFVLASALVASALTRYVIVGAETDPVFGPTSAMAQLGDTISFRFISGNHSVAQSTFAAPCTRMAQGIDSGFQAVAADTTDFPSWNFTINDLAPLWFYCAQETPINHCQAGMVFAINPTADMTFDAFQAAAKASKDTTSPPASATDGGGGGVPTLVSGSPVTTDAGTDTTSGTTGSPMAGATIAPNSAIVSRGLGSAGAVGFVRMVAVVAGLML